jgi:hypothetical protein
MNVPAVQSGTTLMTIMHRTETQVDSNMKREMIDNEGRKIETSLLDPSWKTWLRCNQDGFFSFLFQCCLQDLIEAAANRTSIANRSHSESSTMLVLGTLCESYMYIQSQSLDRVRKNRSSTSCPSSCTTYTVFMPFSNHEWSRYCEVLLTAPLPGTVFTMILMWLERMCSDISVLIGDYRLESACGSSQSMHP